MQKVLITAGASGLGKAMGEAFDATGAQVWVADIDQQASMDMQVYAIHCMKS